MFSTEPWLITLGNNTHITDEVKFITHDGGTLIFPEFKNDYILTGKITIGSNTYIGTRTIILPGVTIGENCIIGAGSVVASDIPNNSVAVGVPAKVKRTTNEYAGKIRKVRNGEYPQYFESIEAARKLDPLKRYE
ncbi:MULTISPECIES: acyltransferase [unclassified Exiguobacterium]|uniref:acyltransferase n=1 Tax=unclassified Exiguobacterium TaxID=2644629 RepID=UPI001BEB675F|nr:MULTISPECIES: acyltransferase [unclassified Exiguobacterium]